MRIPYSYFLQGLALLVGVVLTSALGYEWAPMRGTFSPVAPVAGVALAGLFLGGLRMLPWIASGAAIGRLSEPPDWPPEAIAALLVSNITAYVLAATYLRAGPFHRELSTLADVRRFVVAALILAGLCLFAPLILLTPDLINAAVSPQQVTDILVGLFFGKFSGALVVAGVILTFRAPSLKSLFARQHLRNMTCIASAVAATAVVFGPVHLEGPVTWFLFPLLFLAAFIGGSSLTAKVTLIVSIGTVWGTTSGWGPFAELAHGQSVLQQFLCIFSLTGLVLAATAAERRDKNLLMQRAEDLSFLSDSAVELLLSSNIPASIKKCMPGLVRQCGMDLVLYHSSPEDGHEALQRVAAHGLEAYADDVALLSKLEAQIKDAAQQAQLEGTVTNAAKPHTVKGEMFSLRMFTCFPVLDGKGIRGALSVGSQTRSRIDPAERALLDTIVSYLRAADRRVREEAERKLLLESERAARSAAERADRLKNEFLAVLSHELRNPLNAIVGWTQLLLRGNVESGRAARIIEQSARLQSQLIEDLLDMSRIESGKLALKKSLVDVSSVVAGAYDSMQPAAREKGIRLELHLDPEVKLAKADAVRINQVVVNLLSNALKFTPRGGIVSISLSQEASEAVLKVTDSGEGISEDFLPHIFDRFRQADQSTTRRHGGLGLGLAIAKRMTELHGGTILARSPGVGKGATFIVRLPLTDHHTNGAGVDSLAEADDYASDNRLTGRTVMIVEDDAAFGELLGRTFSDRGASVILCERGAQALEQIRRRIPDLLISDIGMPDMDGYELMRRVRQETDDEAHPPAIAVSAFARPEDVEAALRAGFSAHLSKPVNLHRLEQLANELVPSEPSHQAQPLSGSQGTVEAPSPV